MNVIFAALLFYSLNGFAAQHGDEAAEGGPTATEANAPVVKACFGGCDTQTKSVNFNQMGPDEVNKEWEKIVPRGRVITPEELQKSKATKDEPFDT